MPIRKSKYMYVRTEYLTGYSKIVRQVGRHVRTYVRTSPVYVRTLGFLMLMPKINAKPQTLNPQTLSPKTVNPQTPQIPKP